MLTRIVKMTFKAEHTSHFLKTFAERKHLIAGFEGCSSVKLMRDIDNPNIFFTYSTWHSKGNLEKYRRSEIFTNTWDIVKKLFDDKPQAWSLEDMP